MQSYLPSIRFPQMKLNACILTFCADETSNNIFCKYRSHRNLYCDTVFDIVLLYCVSLEIFLPRHILNK